MADILEESDRCGLHSSPKKDNVERGAPEKTDEAALQLLPKNNIVEKCEGNAESRRQNSHPLSLPFSAEERTKAPESTAQSMLDQIVLKKMHDRLHTSDSTWTGMVQAKEFYPNQEVHVCANNDKGQQSNDGRGLCVRKNKRKRVVTKQDALRVEQTFKSSRMDKAELKVEGLRTDSREISLKGLQNNCLEDTSNDMDAKVFDSAKGCDENPQGNHAGAISGTDHEELEDSGEGHGERTVGCRFQALNATSSPERTTKNLFGMMSKIGDRKRHVCTMCGRSFNQQRVLVIHQQMHNVQQSQKAKDTTEEENKDITKPLLIIQKTEGELKDDQAHEKEQAATCKVHEIGKELVIPVSNDSESSQSRTCLQEVPEQLLEGAKNAKTAQNRTSQPRRNPPDSSESKNGYKCNFCEKVFSLPSFLRRHEVVHTGEKPFACEFCGKCFGQKATKQRHEATHGRNKPFNCQACGDGFSTAKELGKHAKEKHAKSGKDLTGKVKIKLPDANEETKNVVNGVPEDTLENRINSCQEQMVSGDTTHTKEVKLFVCPICEKTFTQRSHLMRHSLCHTGEKPFRCKECGKGFTQKSTCLRHERSHTGELPYMCAECGNGFAQKSGLQKHRLIHSGEKPYKCRFCDDRFTQKTTCQRHERIHTGEKPYLCQECGRAFRQSPSLERHVKTHLKGNNSVKISKP